MPAEEMYVDMSVVACIRVVGVKASNPLAAAESAYAIVAESLAQILSKSFPNDPNLEGCRVECVSWSGQDIESATVDIAWTDETGRSRSREVGAFERDNGAFFTP